MGGHTFAVDWNYNNLF
uniref:Uncharacterized protein n=1 Tax=Anguilla anguilla TaxID=7936 RepID=A0A0E9QNP2_ANGAN